MNEIFASTTSISRFRENLKKHGLRGAEDLEDKGWKTPLDDINLRERVIANRKMISLTSPAVRLSNDVRPINKNFWNKINHLWVPDSLPKFEDLSKKSKLNQIG